MTQSTNNLVFRLYGCHYYDFIGEYNSALKIDRRWKRQKMEKGTMKKSTSLIGYDVVREIN